MKVKDGTLGLNKSDRNVLEALQIFLEDYKVSDIDVEPQIRGVNITTYNRRGDKLFSSWGADVTEAVNNLVRSVTR